MCSNKSEINLGHLDCLQFTNMLWNNTSCSTKKDLYSFYLTELFTIEYRDNVDICFYPAIYLYCLQDYT